MFLIWGWRALNSVLSTGTFHCPQCDVDTTYRHLRPRRWFTVFFIPVIPLKELDAFVECDRCKHAFVEAVLSRQTIQQFEYEVTLARRAALAHLVSASGHPAEADIRAALEFLSTGSSGTYTDRSLWADVSAFADLETARTFVRPLAEHMTIDGREEFLRGAIACSQRVAAPAALSGQVLGSLRAFAETLGISPAHLAGILQASVPLNHADPLNADEAR